MARPNEAGRKPIRRFFDGAEAADVFLSKGAGTKEPVPGKDSFPAGEKRPFACGKRHRDQAPAFSPALGKPPDQSASTRSRMVLSTPSSALEGATKRAFFRISSGALAMAKLKAARSNRGMSL